MEYTDVINNIIRMIFINVIIYKIFVKLIDYKNSNYKQIIIIIVTSIVETVIALWIENFIEDLIAIIIIYLLHSYIISKFTNNRFQYSIIVTFIALTTAYLIYVISIIISSSILKLLFPTILTNNTLILVVSIVIEYIFIDRMFKIKRFKHGILFLQNVEKINSIGFIGFALVGIAILIYSIADTYEYTRFLIIGIIIETICIFIWIRRKITKYYKQKLKERTIEDLEKEIEQKEEQINKILEENRTIATINHKYSNRIQALEQISSQILSKPGIIEKIKTEFGTDFGDIQNQINKISEEFSTEIKEKIKQDKQLIKTGIFGIDNILEYMRTEAEKNNIKFDFKTNANMNYMVENIIDQSKLETLLADHIKDAIIAINSSNNKHKSILTTISIIKNYYEICIYDTGIEFEIKTLLNLGVKPVTTHKRTGGSGTGFITTFKTLKETNASLIIEEKHPMNNTDYTKVVRIRFDGKNEYNICSYRAEKIIEQNKNNGSIIKKINVINTPK